ncbi:MAG TPA: phosphoenolpyruvate--protein phosphotransferase [Pseudonocardia sp.]|uniref:phosphoenolpyruvate--protein phosphotransferase n=1 Tax=Pseudonocardia sp. TaxID=60912 RepID=UPI002C5D5577|nr:phosphoenolpyruvate--protein phosphotransferase [Pseudonocardia sp.]HTF52745.1 phosphoenolpyruvate--protein phosphotransferase [Pseudonocardia sp.]
MVGIVVVSHSRALADAAVALASEMLHGQRVPIEVAAGLDETTFGTDATAIVTAITDADAAADGGVVVLMDLGSAVLSAELALELLDDEVRERVLLCPAPLVEGLVVAVVSAAGGASRAEVAAEAGGALAGKLAQLGGPVEAPAETGSPADRPGELVGSFTVVNPHGLHARPAAVLAARARQFDAQVELRNRTTGSGWVPAASLSKLGTLGALPGHQLEIRAQGSQAEQALDELLALGVRGFDEAPASARPAPPAPARPAPAAAPSAAARSATDRAVTTAPIAASPGLGIGPACPLRTDAPVPVDEASDKGDTDPAAEWRRLTDAVDIAREDIQRVRARATEQVGEAEASIFDAHLAMLDDPELLGGAHTRIDGGAAAATAWATSIAEAHDALAALDDEYLRARAADVRAVGDQVLRALAGGPAEVASPEGVLVAADLTPAQAAELDAARVDAVVLAYGSLTAHATILLRALGIPAVVAAGPAVLAIPEGTLVAVDGIRGEVLVDPDTEVQRALRERAEALAEQDREARALTNQPAATLNGVPVSVAANIGSVADALAAAERGADLAGLVRTEFLFLGRDRAPDAAEQEHSYREIADALHGRRITLRTLDVGGDKPLSYLPTPAEANPFLGLRGIRLALARPELLAEQLLAIVRVAHDTPVDLMFPMVSTLDELLSARRMLTEAIETAGEAEPPELRVGIMVEVPATALKAAVFAPHVDFFSIGTNDLTQYTLAAERGNDNVAALGDPLDPGVLRLIDAVCRAAGGGAGPLVAVCGELAADELAVPLLLGLGVRELSVNPRAVPGVKQAVRAVDLPKAVELAARTLRAESATAVRTLLTEFTS